MTDDRSNVGSVSWSGKIVALSPGPMPVIYFDNAPTLSHMNGVIGVTLTVSGNVPDAANDGVQTIISVVGHLKCNVNAAKALIDALQSALLLAEPAANSDVLSS